MSEQVNAVKFQNLKTAAIALAAIALAAIVERVISGAADTITEDDLSAFEAFKIAASPSVILDLFEDREKLQVDAERLDIMRATMVDNAFAEKLDVLTDHIETLHAPSFEEFNDRVDLCLQIAKKHGLWPIKAVEVAQ